MSQMFKLAAVVAAAVALSNGDHKRRISGFLAGSNGMEIPDEDGHRWLARLQDDGFVRLEESWNGGYQEHFIRVEDLESLRVGGDAPAELEMEDPATPEDGSVALRAEELGIPLEKVHGLILLTNRQRVALQSNEAWTPEMEEDVNNWYKSLDDSELESLAKVAAEVEHPATPGDESAVLQAEDSEVPGNPATPGDGQKAEVEPGQGSMLMPPAPELEVPGLIEPEKTEEGSRETEGTAHGPVAPEDGQKAEVEPEKAKKGKKDKTNADV